MSSYNLFDNCRTSLKKNHFCCLISIGRHCCLYCNTTYANMQPQKKDQAANTPRSLKTLQEKLNKFRTAGGNDIKNAKQYDNVIDDAMFNVELDQV